VGEWAYPTLFWSDAYNYRYPVAINSGAIYGDKRFFFIYLPQNCFLPAIYLNSTITPLFIELQGIANLGEGAIYTNVYWLQGYPVLTDIPDLPCTIFAAFHHFCERPVRSIFEELGFELCRKRRCDHPEHPYEQVMPEALTLEQVQRASPDRFELDAVIFDVLGLTDDERLAVYKAVAQLVKDRLVKARSV